MEKCGEVIWERGLLLKGLGLCHGTAGNAYSLLSLYQSTGRDYHLHRAIKASVILKLTCLSVFYD